MIQKDVNPEQSIEIVIGDEDNTKTVFRYLEMMPPGNIAEANTFNILSCNQMRHFWLSWKDDKIRLGNWHIYDYNVVLEAEIGAGYPVRAISLATPTEDGVWMIRDSFGMLYDHIPYIHIFFYRVFLSESISGFSEHIVLSLITVFITIFR